MWVVNRPTSLSTRFAAMLQNKLHVVCCPFYRTFRLRRYFHWCLRFLYKPLNRDVTQLFPDVLLTYILLESQFKDFIFLIGMYQVSYDVLQRRIGESTAICRSGTQLKLAVGNKEVWPWLLTGGDYCFTTKRAWGLGNLSLSLTLPRSRAGTPAEQPCM